MSSFNVSICMNICGKTKEAIEKLPAVTCFWLRCEVARLHDGKMQDLGGRKMGGSTCIFWGQLLLWDVLSNDQVEDGRPGK